VSVFELKSATKPRCTNLVELVQNWMFNSHPWQQWGCMCKIWIWEIWVWLPKMPNFAHASQKCPILRAGHQTVRHCIVINVPWTRTVYGSCAFSVAVPTPWNSLSADITNTTSLTVFRNCLKTFLFHQNPLTAQLTSPAVKHLWIFGFYGAM